MTGVLNHAADRHKNEKSPAGVGWNARRGQEEKDSSLGSKLSPKGEPVRVAYLQTQTLTRLQQV